jgi:hypothetical protein
MLIKVESSPPLPPCEESDATLPVKCYSSISGKRNLLDLSRATSPHRTLHGFEIAIQSGYSHKILFASYHIAQMSAVMVDDGSTTARYSFVYLAKLGYQRVPTAQ